MRLASVAVSCYHAAGPINQGVIVKVITGCKAIRPIESEGAITILQTTLSNPPLPAAPFSSVAHVSYGWCLSCT